MPPLQRVALQDVQQAYARLFATQDGRAVLDHLHRTTFLKAHHADAAGETIRYAEGQRALVAQILRHIEAGRSARA